MVRSETVGQVVDDFWRANDIASDSVSTWMRQQSKPDPVAVVFYGAIHLEGGERYLRARIEAAGWRTVTLVPFLKHWELALRVRFGAAANRAWFQVSDHIYRPGLITDQDVLSNLEQRR